jgi:hypothetical protein
MGPAANVCALLLRLAAFVGWTLSRVIATRRGLVNLLAGVGILALLFSVVSPDDDLVQQELIRPATPALTLAAQTRAVPRRPPISFSFAALMAADRILVSRTGRFFVTDQPRKCETRFHSSILIHSPPTAFMGWS